MKICSFLPSATEILYRLGLGDKIVGISDDCHFPPEVTSKPVVVRCVLNEREYSAKETYEVESVYWSRRENIYKIDKALLKSSDPDLVFVQDICPECAVTGNEVADAIRDIPHRPKIVSLTHKNLDQVMENILQVGEVTDRLTAAENLVDELRQRLRKISSIVKDVPQRPRALCVSGLHPLLGAGYWMPEMVELAAGCDGLGKVGGPAYRISMEDIERYDPDTVVVMHCSYDVGRMERNMAFLTSLDGWQDLRAVREGSVYLVDSGSYFSCPGPRLVEGVRILAKIFHPDVFTEDLPERSFKRFHEG